MKRMVQSSVGTAPKELKRTSQTLTLTLTPIHYSLFTAPITSPSP